MNTSIPKAEDLSAMGEGPRAQAKKGWGKVEACEGLLLIYDNLGKCSLWEVGTIVKKRLLAMFLRLVTGLVASQGRTNAAISRRADIEREQ